MQTRTQQLMSLWHKHHTSYVERPRLYEQLLAEKIRLNIKPLNKINRTMLREYPDIPFLREATAHEAEEFMSKMTASEVDRAIYMIENLWMNYTYATMLAFINDAKYRIAQHGKPRCPYGVDPDRCRSKGYHHNSGHIGSDSDR